MNPTLWRIADQGSVFSIQKKEPLMYWKEVMWTTTYAQAVDILQKLTYYYPLQIA